MESPVKQNKVLKSVLTYTGAFIVCAFVAFMWHILTGRTFMWYNDGYEQHYKVMLFYSDFLRDVINSLLHGRLSDISTYSYLLGEGGDILGVLNYYGVGDPLFLITLFFSANNMYVCYCAIVLIRLYLGGLSFLYLCRYFGVGSLKARIAGAMTYIFSIWGIYQSCRHIMFLIPLIYLPLMIVGVEKAFKKEKSVLFVVAVFLSAISNFYYFYNLVLLVVIYAVIRCIILFGKDIYSYINSFLIVLLEAVVGVMMSAVILAPVIYTFLTDARSSGAYSLHVVGDLLFYLAFPAGLISTQALSLGISAPVILALIILFAARGSNNKASLTLKVLSITCLVFLLIPAIGQIFNGFSYATNKWVFALNLLLGFVLTYYFDEFVDKFDKKAFTTSLIVAGLFIFMMVFEANRNIEYLINVLILLALILLVRFELKKESANIRGGIIIAFVVLSIGMNSFWINSYGGQNYAAECRRPSELLTSDNNNEALYIGALGDSEFYRYSGNKIYRNGSLVTGVPSVMYFWTNTNAYSVNFNNVMNLIYYHMHEYPNFDERTVLNELASVKYYALTEDFNYPPYGYEPIAEQGCDGYTIYENQYALGLTYSSPDIYSYQYYYSLDSVRRQELLMSGVVADGSFDFCDDYEHEFLSRDVEFTSSPSDGVVFDVENGIFSGGQNPVVLSFEGMPNSETYITFEGLRRVDGESDGMIAISSGDGVIKVLEFYEDGYQYYNDRRDFTVNLGYREEALNQIRIALILPGEVAFDDVRITCEPMDNYAADALALRANSLDDVVMDPGLVSGHIDVDDSRMLVFALPYSDGWSATVNGERAELYRVDTKYMGLYLEPGSYDIELHYVTPYLSAGAWLSVIGFALFVVVVGYKGKNRG